MSDLPIAIRPEYLLAMPAGRPTGTREAEILAQLWASGDYVTAGEVRDALGGELAYTTVLTILTRLWRKGLAERTRRGRGYAYRPTVSESQLIAQRMQDSLDRSADRHAALAAFVGNLSARDSDALRRVLQDMDEQRPRRKR